MYLPAPAIAPSAESIQAFCARAQQAKPSLELIADNVEVRWIGLDADSTLQIFELIRAKAPKRALDDAIAASQRKKLEWEE